MKENLTSSRLHKMTLKKKYQTKESAIASYDYTDLAEGTGIVVYYGSDTEDNGTTTYQLSKNIVYSQNLVTVATGTSGEERVLDIDFDLTFNIPQRIKGKVIANIPVISGQESSVNQGGTLYAILKVRHVTAAGAETDLASNTKSVVTANSGNQDTVQTMLNVEVDVAALKLFKQNETLRLTVELWALVQSANGHTMGLLHDPKNRTPTSTDYIQGIDAAEFITSTLTFNVPFIIPTL